MTAALIWYTAITSVCVAAAAFATESLLRQLGRPLRWAWVAALALCVTLPALAPWRRSIDQTSDTAAAATIEPGLIRFAPGMPQVPPRTSDALRNIWIALGAGMLLLVAGIHIRYRTLRKRWSPVSLGDEPVMLSPDTGPAVMGVWRPDIVVPRWILLRDSMEQRMIVSHEREHIRNRDPVLLAGAVVVVALMPWSPVLWWILARLRLAVELDCDARVLRRGAVPLDYGNLLIDVAALTAGHRLPAPALLNPTSHLQRRLLAMRPSTVRFPRIRGMLAAALAAASVAAACQVALPTDAEIAELDAGKATRAARLMGLVADSVVYVVDGRPITEAEAIELEADTIITATVRRTRSDASLQVDTIELRTGGLIAAEAPSREARAEGSPQVLLKGSSQELVKGRFPGGFTGLIIVDGELATESRMIEIDPRDIARIEVLKGSAARLIYGEKGKAGVIRVTTKQ